MTKRVMLGMGMPRWSHACWDWLHRLEVIPEGMLSILPSLLPCPVCSLHMSRYILQNPLYEPHREWVIDLHNDVNIRLGKPVVEYADAPVLPMDNVGLTQFLFAVTFTMSRDQTDDFWELCGLLPGNMLPQRPSSHHVHPSEALWRALPHAYDSYSDVIMDFVPPRHYHHYISSRKEEEPEPVRRRRRVVWPFVPALVIVGLASRGALRVILVLSVLVVLFVHLYTQ